MRCKKESRILINYALEFMVQSDEFKFKSPTILEITQ